MFKCLVWLSGAVSAPLSPFTWISFPDPPSKIYAWSSAIPKWGTIWIWGIKVSVSQCSKKEWKHCWQPSCLPSILKGDEALGSVPRFLVEGIENKGLHSSILCWANEWKICTLIVIKYIEAVSSSKRLQPSKCLETGDYFGKALCMLAVLLFSRFLARVWRAVCMDHFLLLALGPVPKYCIEFIRQNLFCFVNNRLYVFWTLAWGNVPLQVKGLLVETSGSAKAWAKPAHLDMSWERERVNKERKNLLLETFSSPALLSVKLWSSQQLSNAEEPVYPEQATDPATAVA